MTCPSCKTKVTTVISRIFQGSIQVGCDNCLTNNTNQEASGIAKYKRDRQREDYRKDITQPNQGQAFIRAYGVEKSRKYMTDETIRKLA